MADEKVIEDDQCGEQLRNAHGGSVVDEPVQEM